MEGYTASAYVEMLKKQEEVALGQMNMTRVAHEQGAYAFARAAEHLDTIRGLLAEAVKLRNAIVNGWEWRIQQDGTVWVDRPLSNIQMPIQKPMDVS